MTYSLRRRLFTGVLGTLAVGCLLLMTATYLLTLQEMEETFDDHLKQVALAVAVTRPPPSDAVRMAPVFGTEVADDDEGFDFLTLVSAADGRLVFSSDPLVRQPFPLQPGFTVATARGAAWRVYTVAGRGEVVQAAQRTAAREDLAFDAAVQQLTMLLLLTALIALALVFVLRRGLAPLDKVAAELALRRDGSLDALAAAPLPTELRPLVAAINSLMQRLGSALAGQRIFVADAAHALRTPVAALRLQLQLLERAADPAARQQCLDELRGGIDRSQRLIEQLLALSRSGAAAATPTANAPVDLGELVRSVVGQRSVQAERNGIDLGAVTTEAATVIGDRDQLEVLLGNLVDNALAYTPAGGRVDVVASRLLPPAGGAGVATLAVIDSGPGIAVADRQRVFDRFYRGAGAGADNGHGADNGRGASAPGKPPGSGLGLAIVAAIAERHGASVSLHDAAGGQGLEVRLLFNPPQPGPLFHDQGQRPES